MKKKIFFVLTTLFCCSRLYAQVKFEDARIYTPLKGSNITAGYVNIKNSGAKEVEVVLKKVEKFKAYETHETLEESGKMVMRKVESFKIPAGATLELKPGGKHIMLFDPTEVIKAGATVKAVFAINGKEETALFKVQDRAQSSDEHSHH